MDKLVWEEVESGLNRAAIPGGWLLRQYEQFYQARNEQWEWQIVSLCFMPDPGHSWKK